MPVELDVQIHTLVDICVYVCACKGEREHMGHICVYVCACKGEREHMGHILAMPVEQCVWICIDGCV